MADPKPATQKTLPTEVPPEEFLATIPERSRRERGERLLELFRDETGEDAVMWGPSIVGFGTVRLKYDSGREGDWPRVGFSPRKGAMTLYGLTDHAELEPLLERLGTYTRSVACVYIKKLEDVDEAALRELVRRAYRLAQRVDA
ncbi:DUF1801 domain-containing protein [Ruicaihuangia caeni]|uniref:DUF1801 domain-containing protein n=1 Tax=Ruicaihuangia caeni TaxID=3042517 RepID=UPI00338F7564